MTHILLRLDRSAGKPKIIPAAFCETEGECWFHALVNHFECGTVYAMPVADLPEMLKEQRKVRLWLAENDVLGAEMREVVHEFAVYLVGLAWENLSQEERVDAVQRGRAVGVDLKGMLKEGKFAK